MRWPILCALVLAWVSPVEAKVLDIAGHAVPRKPYHRIVSLAPSNTELLYAIGWGDKVAGVSSDSDYPPATARLPKVGGYATLNVERVVALDPDLILSIPIKSPAVRQIARLSHAPVVELKSDSLGAIAQDAIMLGELIGPEGRTFAERFRSELSAIKPSRRRPRAFYMVWDQPLMTAGRSTYLDDLIRRAGGINVARVEGYASYSLERLLCDKPDVILYPDTNKVAGEALAKRLHATAIALPSDQVSRPGPRVLQALGALVKRFDERGDRPGNVRR